MKQAARVLVSLRAAGPNGITQGDWLDVTPDNGPRITRVGARVFELIEAGHEIIKVGRRDDYTVYVLVEQASGHISAPVPVPVEPAPLFDGPSMYDPYADAA